MLSDELWRRVKGGITSCELIGGKLAGGQPTGHPYGDWRLLVGPISVAKVTRKVDVELTMLPIV